MSIFAVKILVKVRVHWPLFVLQEEKEFLQRKNHNWTFTKITCGL